MDFHNARARGRGSSFLVPHEATHFLTSSCWMPIPASSERMAFLIPTTCHSLMSRYSLIACAARNARLRPVFLASSSSRFLVERSTRTENVALLSVLFICVHCSTLVIIPGITNNIVFDACTKALKTWRYTNDLNRF